MKQLENILPAVGNTPLVKICNMVSPEMATVWGKCEFMNPTGSVKDRIASYIVDLAEQKGDLKPGSTIIEATAGNTGLSFAMVAAVRGYRCIFVLTEKFAGEKVDMLKAYGAEVVITQGDWLETAEHFVKETPNSFYVNQFHNSDNSEAHYRITGPEIWEQTNGEIDYFVAGAGSGGTISGVGRFLKEKAKEAGREIKIICPDPEGSAFYNAFYKKEPSKKQAYRVEGIGNDMIPSTLDFDYIDEFIKVNDRDSFYTARKASRTEGLFIGGSAGSNLHVSLELARKVGPDKNIVTVLCDSGNRYISKMYNDAWMKDQGFRELDSHLGTVGELLKLKGNTPVELAEPSETLAKVIERMSRLGISQMPLSAKKGGPLKIVHEADLLHALVSSKRSPEDKIEEVATRLDGQVSSNDPVHLLERIFDEGNVGVVVDNGAISGVVTKIDLVRFLSSRTS